RALAQLAHAMQQSLPQLTSIDAALRANQFRKTNPIPPPRRCLSEPEDPDPPPNRSPAPPLSNPQPSNAQNEPKVDPSLPALTAVDVLSPRQLAGARLLAAGRSTSDVARELRITRQAVWKWTRIPEFRQELTALHRLLATRGG